MACSIYIYVINFVDDIWQGSLIYSGPPTPVSSNEYNWPPSYNWNIVENGIYIHNL